jgi:nickel-dependent lactate racemase
VIGVSVAPRALSEEEIRGVLAGALGREDLAGKRVLVVVPDGTRTAPVALVRASLDEVVAPQAAALDYLVALGTHPPMDDAALGRLLGTPVRNGRAGRSLVFNHRWDVPETCATLGAIPAVELSTLSGGRLELEVPVRINRLVGSLERRPAYDHVLVCGPVFPHEVVGFSGGNKYFFPGVAAPEIINVTHWLGALLTSREVIGVADTPVRRLIDRAASFIPTPRTYIAPVMRHAAVHGLFIGTMEKAWKAATVVSAELDIVRVEKPFRRVLSVVPEMYEDLWTAAKGMYKVEPAIADGGEVVIFAPHIREVSRVHGRYLDEIGYHVRDYFLANWERFRRYPWGVLAHSTHLRGAGTYEGGVERARIRVTLASGIPKARCERLGLAYMDPRTVDPQTWADREHEGILLVRRAGEILYQLKTPAPRDEVALEAGRSV